MLRTKMTVALLACLAMSGFAAASEADEIRERGDTPPRETEERAEQGHHDDAATLNRNVESILNDAGRFEPRRQHLHDRGVADLRKRLDDLHRRERELMETDGPRERIAEVREAMRQTEHELENHLRRPERQHDPHGDIARRLEHMRIAIEHLNHAELHEIAGHVAEQADAAERKMNEHRSPQTNAPLQGIMTQIDELRHELRELRDEIRRNRKE